MRCRIIISMLVWKIAHKNAVNSNVSKYTRRVHTHAANGANAMEREKKMHRMLISIAHASGANGVPKKKKKWKMNYCNTKHVQIIIWFCFIKFSTKLLSMEKRFASACAWARYHSLSPKHIRIQSERLAFYFKHLYEIAMCHYHIVTTISFRWPNSIGVKIEQSILVTWSFFPRPHSMLFV